MSVIFGLLFSYSAIDLIRNAPQLIISEEGLFVRKHGWYHWDLLDAYWIEVEKDHENEPKEYLMIRLKGGELIKCMIRDFDLSSTEIYSGIDRYKSNYSKNIHHQG
ncbi:MAG: hypothetical protein A1D16_05265 [Flavihumibacter sp. CACIAM 22H1]|nr:MAG: hypothetical protein A1D16_05265 [Flavihumibacter sp. CACIAM 22H1]